MSLTSKVAFVIDALPGIGGSEKVLMSALELFPGAPIYTLLFNRDNFANTSLINQQVFTSMIDHIPLARAHYRKYLPVMPFAIRHFDLSAYDTILSFSYAVAHGIRVLPGQKHFSYTFTPMRYAWRNFRFGIHQRQIIGAESILRLFRKWDVRVSRSIDHNAAVSHWIAECIKQVYQREAAVIYPPVEIERFSPASERGDYYITLSRLVPYKRIDLIVEAFNELKLPLVIVGEGPERQRLQRRAKDNVHFLGFQSNATVNGLLNRARAFICACEEDFGIAMVEAQAAGCPVIAYRKGGALEIVLEDRTGIFFDELSAEYLEQAVIQFSRSKLSNVDSAANARRFNKQRFLSELAAFINKEDWSSSSFLQSS